MKGYFNAGIVIATFFMSTTVAHACELHRSQWIDKMVKRGDIALTFKPNGDLSSVSCNRKKYTALQCKNANRYVFEYYRNKKKE